METKAITMNLNSKYLKQRLAAVDYLRKNGYRPLGHGEFVKDNKVYNFNYVKLFYLKEIEEQQLFVVRELS